MFSFCPDGVSICLEYLNPCSLLLSYTPFGDMYVHKTPQSPLQKTPFPGLNLKVGKMNYRLGNLDPNWAKCLKSGQNFSGSGQNGFQVIHIHNLPDSIVNCGNCYHLQLALQPKERT